MRTKAGHFVFQAVLVISETRKLSTRLRLVDEFFRIERDYEVTSSDFKEQLYLNINWFQ